MVHQRHKNYENIEEAKYRLFWFIGTILSFILYFSGIAWIFTFIRKRILKKFISTVIMYHRIRNDNKDLDISVTTKTFDRQMKYLKTHFDVASLDTLIDNIKKKTRTKTDSVAITFDDGYKDNYSNAYFILKKCKLPATIFLITGEIGKNDDMLNADEIHKMENERITFGSHTVNHQVLSKVSEEIATKEIVNSRLDLEEIINKKVKFFAYPKGKRYHFNEVIKAFVKNTGYKAAFTTENGQINEESDLFELKRIGIRNCPLFVFKVRVSGIFESRIIYFVRNVFKMT